MGSLKGAKIELNSVKQLQADISEMKGRANRIEADGTKLAGMLADCIRLKDAIGKDVQFLNGAATGAKSDIDAFIANGKNLGVDVSGQADVKELQSLIAESKEYVSWFNGIGKIPQI